MVGRIICPLKASRYYYRMLPKKALFITKLVAILKILHGMGDVRSLKIVQAASIHRRFMHDMRYGVYMGIPTLLQKGRVSYYR